jgi:hypothetical protein
MVSSGSSSQPLYARRGHHPNTKPNTTEKRIASLTQCVSTLLAQTFSPTQALKDYSTQTAKRRRMQHNNEYYSSFKLTLSSSTSDCMVKEVAGVAVDEPLTHMV